MKKNIKEDLFLQKIKKIIFRQFKNMIIFQQVIIGRQAFAKKINYLKFLI